jgi:hypothetical protein
VTCAHFEPEDEGQAELFADPAQDRDRELDRLVDGVNERFGQVLRRGGPRRGRG